MVRIASVTVGLALAASFLVACDNQPAETPKAEAAATAGPAAPTLPISLNAVMVAMVNEASDPIWLDAYDPPKNDREWQALVYHGYQMAVDGKVIQLAGNGPNDAAWVKDPQWIRFADEMSAAGMDAVAAAKARDVVAVGKAGDRLVEACEGCHKIFKPELPSMGLYHPPTWPPGYQPKD